MVYLDALDSKTFNRMKIYLTKKSSCVNARGISPAPHNRPGSVWLGGVPLVLVRGHTPCHGWGGTSYPGWGVPLVLAGGYLPVLAKGVPPVLVGGCTPVLGWTGDRTGVSPPWAGLSIGPVTGRGYSPPPGKDLGPETMKGPRTWDQRPWGTLPPPCGQTHTCENSTFPHPSDAGGDN